MGLLDAGVGNGRKGIAVVRCVSVGCGGWVFAFRDWQELLQAVEQVCGGFNKLLTQGFLKFLLGIIAKLRESTHEYVSICRGGFGECDAVKLVKNWFIGQICCFW